MTSPVTQRTPGAVYPDRFFGAPERSRRIGRVLRLAARVDELDEELVDRIGRRMFTRDELGARLVRAMGRDVPAAQPHGAADAPQETAARNGDEAGSADERKDDAPQSTEETRTEAAGAGEAGAPVEVRVSMLVHTDLAKRAERWGKTMGLSGVTVLRQSFAKLKPELMAELKTVKAGDIHLERAESVGPRIQSLLRFSAADYADMQARLDPAGFGIVASMLNHHARARFSSFLDELMANAGY